MSDTVQEIKEKIDIVDFIRSYLSLAPAGRNFKAICPFHKEKTPSFIVSPDRRIWHCFGCSQGGDVIKFLMLYENLDFFEALKILAEKAGVKLTASVGGDSRRYNILYEINQSAKDFFKKQLTPDILKYLQDRGLKKEIIQEFEIGFTSNNSDSLIKHLLKFGCQINDIVAAGLAIKTERGTYWDRFRERIVFPFYNSFGKIAGFSGRLAPEVQNSNLGKYINSPETLIFNKSKLLFGFHKAKECIRNEHAAILVEGQMDFLMLWQDGIKNVVATSGTALTPDHLKILSRLADVLTINFDADEAGQSATERAIDLAEAKDFIVKIIKLDRKDPADFVKFNPGIFKTKIIQAQLWTDYYLDKYLKEEQDSVNLKKNVRLILSKIKTISSSIQQGQWIKEISKRTGILENLLIDESNTLKESTSLSLDSQEDQEDKENSEKEVLSRKELISDQLINLALSKKEFKEELKNYSQYLPQTHNDVLFVDSQNLNNNLIFLRSSLYWIDQDKNKIDQHFKELLRQLQLEYWKEKREGALCLIREAEDKKNEEALLKFLQEFDRINKQIHNLSQI